MNPGATPLLSVAVGVVVARRKAVSQWIDFTWAPVAVLDGVPETEPWTVLRSDDETTTFYAGSANIELYRSETTYYRDNLASGTPALWVVMTSTEDDHQPYQLVAVTADPAEGEGFTESAANLVEQVPMPQPIQEIIAAFVAEHHVEREFFKRRRDRADPESLARRDQGDHDE